MTINWTLANTMVSWDGIGPLGPFSPTFSASGPCALMANSVNYDCNLTSSQVTLFDSYPVPLAPYVKLALAADVTISPQGIATLRQASFDGTPDLNPDGTASLSLGESPITDSLSIPCTVGAGSDLSYSLGSLSSTLGIQVNSSLVFDVGLESPNPLPPFNELDASFATPSIPLGSSASSIVMAGAGASFDMGTVLPNNIPPVANAGGPYSGNEGSPITFDGSGSSSICGFPTLRWDFSDGGVAFGESPQHTFEAPGTYSGLLTAIDTTGLTSTTTFSVTVADLPPVTNAGPNMSTEWGIPVTLNGSAVDPGTAQQPFLSYSWNFGDGTPSASGGASVTHDYTTPGTYMATFTACDPEAMCGSSTTQVVVNERGSVLSYTGDTTSAVTDPATIKASLVDDTGAAVVGRVVQFYADGSVTPFASAATNAFGTASVPYPWPLGSVGSHTIVAAFAGDGRYTQSQFSTAFSVSKDGTILTYTGLVSSKPSKALTMTATLTDDAGRPLAGLTASFSLGAQDCSAATNIAGVASCTIAKLTEKPGNYVLTAGFAGTSNYLASSASVGFSI